MSLYFDFFFLRAKNFGSKIVPFRIKPDFKLPYNSLLTKYHIQYLFSKKKKKESFRSILINGYLSICHVDKKCFNFLFIKAFSYKFCLLLIVNILQL